MLALKRGFIGFFHQTRTSQKIFGHHGLPALSCRFHGGSAGCDQKRTGSTPDQFRSLSISDKEAQKLNTLVQQTTRKFCAPSICRNWNSWTKEEDEIIYEAIENRQSTFEILKLFSDRTVQSIDIRMSLAKRAQRPDGTIENVFPINKYKAYERNQDGSMKKLKGKVQISQMKRFKAAYPYRRRPWTDEEDSLLIDLVRKYAGRPGMWTLAAEATVDGIDGARVLDRTSGSCRSRWETLIESTQGSKGLWTPEESDKLVKAVKKQLPRAIAKDLFAKDRKQKKHPVEQEATDSSPSETSQKEVVVVDVAWSAMLEVIDWDDVATAVGTRNIRQCKRRFRRRYFSSPNRSHWSPEELDRFKEAVK
ncbi:hypothetical protein BGW38_001828, partial [Lunasporangiospora selenospora]